MQLASTCFQMQEVLSSNLITYHRGTSRSVAWCCLVMQPHGDINASLRLLARSETNKKAVTDSQTPMIL